SRSAPDFVGRLLDETQFGDLVVECDAVALDCRGKSALRRQAKLIERNEPAGLVNAPFELVLCLEGAALGGDQSEDHHFSLGHAAQWFEATGPHVVVLEEETV